jgi:hypothetical protein
MLIDEEEYTALPHFALMRAAACALNRRTRSHARAHMQLRALDTQYITLGAVTFMTLPVRGCEESAMERCHGAVDEAVICAPADGVRPLASAEEPAYSV